ncbi:MAG: hypothetical protein IH919_05870 [Deltaproteobacteria bacterium]|nr:hypothetical protein [Deltaproteobacteria bacterium]
MAVLLAGLEFGPLFFHQRAKLTHIFALGEAVGEKVWRLPLSDAYDRQIRSDIADMKNVGGRGAGAQISSRRA